MSDNRLVATGIAIFLAIFLAGAVVGVLASRDEPVIKVVASKPSEAPAEVYVLQSFYDDLTFVDGVFSSPDEAEAWIEGTHGSFERSGRDGILTYEAGDFTYLVTPYEVDHG